MNKKNKQINYDKTKSLATNDFIFRLLKRQKFFKLLGQLQKMIAELPGSQTPIKNTMLAAESGMFKGIRNI